MARPEMVFHLRRCDPAVRQAKQFWRDLCLPERCLGVFSILFIGQNHSPDESNRRLGDLLHPFILAGFATLLATKMLRRAVVLRSMAKAGASEKMAHIEVHSCVPSTADSPL
jgi:hypothetical protein